MTARCFESDITNNFLIPFLDFQKNPILGSNPVPYIMLGILVALLTYLLTILFKVVREYYSFTDIFGIIPRGVLWFFFIVFISYTIVIDLRVICSHTARFPHDLNLVLLLAMFTSIFLIGLYCFIEIILFAIYFSNYSRVFPKKDITITELQDKLKKFKLNDLFKK